MKYASRHGLEWTLGYAEHVERRIANAAVKDKFTIALWLIDLVLRREDGPRWAKSKEDEFDMNHYAEYQNAQIENNPARKLSGIEWE